MIGPTPGHFSRSRPMFASAMPEPTSPSGSMRFVSSRTTSDHKPWRRDSSPLAAPDWCSSATPKLCHDCGEIVSSRNTAARNNLTSSPLGAPSFARLSAF
eukprot:1115003-Prymnesium_polylepis.1